MNPRHHYPVLVSCRQSSLLNTVWTSTQYRPQRAVYKLHFLTSRGTSNCCRPSSCLPLKVLRIHYCMPSSSEQMTHYWIQVEPCSAAEFGRWLTAVAWSSRLKLHYKVTTLNQLANKRVFRSRWASSKYFETWWEKGICGNKNFFSSNFVSSYNWHPSTGKEENNS